MDEHEVEEAAKNLQMDGSLALTFIDHVRSECAAFGRQVIRAEPEFPGAVRQCSERVLRPQTRNDPVQEGADLRWQRVEGAVEGVDGQRIGGEVRQQFDEFAGA